MFQDISVSTQLESVSSTSLTTFDRSGDIRGHGWPVVREMHGLIHTVLSGVTREYNVMTHLQQAGPECSWYNHLVGIVKGGFTSQDTFVIFEEDSVRLLTCQYLLTKVIRALLLDPLVECDWFGTFCLRMCRHDSLVFLHQGGCQRKSAR